jgi:L-iditol 2-dehydrogenase
MYYNNRDIRLEEMPKPQIGSGEVLIRVEACGICGSDVMEWYRLAKAPLVQGHEIAGEIVEMGQGVERWKNGDRVFAYHHVPCNTCHYCVRGHHTVCDTFRNTHFDPGGFAEYVRVPAINVDRGLYPLLEDISFEEATFIEPLACAVRGQRLARMKTGDSVLIIGSGIVGLLQVQLARVMEASHVVATDVVDNRLEAAEKFGADAVIHGKQDVPALFRKINDGRLADLVVVCTGVLPAIEQGLQSVERGGTILFFAPTEPGGKVSINVNDLLFNEITVTSSYSGSREDACIALDLIQTRRVRVRGMITHRFGLAETGEGFKLVAEPKDSIKVIIEPQK